MFKSAFVESPALSKEAVSSAIAPEISGPVASFSTIAFSVATSDFAVEKKPYYL